ncbi:MAG: dockerin type I repeat-containing protein, partial [Oscillospiraceae bacterium]
MKNLIKKIISLILVLSFVFTYSITVFSNELDIKGDVNKNGKLDSLDALMILKHVAQITVLNDEQLTFADFNSNGKVDTLDALRVLKRVAGIIPPTINEKDYQATSEFILREENAYKYINFSNLINNEYFLLTLGSCNDDMLYNISAAKELLDKTSTLEQ